MTGLNLTCRAAPLPCAGVADLSVDVEACESYSSLLDAGLVFR